MVLTPVKQQCDTPSLNHKLKETHFNDKHNAFQTGREKG